MMRKIAVSITALCFGFAAATPVFAESADKSSPAGTMYEKERPVPAQTGAARGSAADPEQGDKLFKKERPVPTAPNEQEAPRGSAADPDQSGKLFEKERPAPDAPTQ